MHGGGPTRRFEQSSTRMQFRRTPKRIKKFINEHGLADRLHEVLRDPRRRKGRSWSFNYILDVVFTAIALQATTLAEAESISEGIGPRLPDSSMAYTLERIDPTPLRSELRRQVRTMLRSKTLAPVGLPMGVVSVDGKTSWTGTHLADPEAQLQDGRYNLRWMRAVLVSAASRPCIDQDVIPAKTNEMGHLATFWAALVEAYGRSSLFEAVTLDAGYTSKENAALIDRDGYAYVMRVKCTQPTLLDELQRQLAGRIHEPEATTPWESRHGRQLQQRLVRSQEMADYDGWAHLRQGWLVQTVERDAKGVEHVVLERWYITNLLWNRLTGRQILELVRRHWAIENDCNWVLDVEWKEDTHPWCTNASEARDHHPQRTLSWLRMLGYNLVTWLMRVRLRSRPKWRELRDALRAVLLSMPTSIELEVAFATLA